MHDAMRHSKKCLEDSGKTSGQSQHLKITLKGEEQFEKESRAQGHDPEAGSHAVWEVVLGRTWSPWLGMVGDATGKEYEHSGLTD